MSTQPLLFDDLPETERVRKPARRSRATTLAEPVAVDVVREMVPAPPPTHMVPPRPAFPPPAAPATEPFDPASLTNAELRALVQALSDARLGHLLTEAARELKRRVVPNHWDEESGPFEPDQALLRAARQAVGELSGEDA
jgi:hypothetical protein